MDQLQLGRRARRAGATSHGAWTLSAALLALCACGPSRVETTPSSVQLFARGQKVEVHAVGVASSGREMADHVCKWSSSDESVAKVAGPHNVGTITAIGHGRVIARCQMGGATAEVPVTVTLVRQVDVAPPHLELRVLDEPAPARLEVKAIDADGRPVQGRPVFITCLDENVCRGDARGQVWAVGAGETRATVQVDDGQASVAVHVVDARSPAARPRTVKGNPMEHIADEPPAPRSRSR